MKRSGLERRTPLKRGELKRGPGVEKAAGPKRSVSPRRTPVSSATPAQRERVKDRACIVCGTHPVDPAHVIDRSLTPSAGDDVRAVVPLCRFPCHHDYDEGDLDISPYLEPEWRDSLAWAVEAVGLFRALKRITKATWVILPAEEAA
jgi:hypothetical protein